MVGTIVIYTTELAFSMAYECASFLHAKQIYFLDYVQCTLTTDDDNFSLQASDDSTYLHGQPTNKAYVVELTTFQPRLFIVGSVVGHSNGINWIKFLAADHPAAWFCVFC